LKYNFPAIEQNNSRRLSSKSRERERERERDLKSVKKESASTQRDENVVQKSG